MRPPANPPVQPRCGAMRRFASANYRGRGRASPMQQPPETFGAFPRHIINPVRTVSSTRSTMNKAFTRESDASDDEDDVEVLSPLPVGARNYMTPGGFARLSAELEQLVQ